MWIWDLFSEAVAEEILALTAPMKASMKKPKEVVKVEINDHINLKVVGQDGSVVQFKI